MRVITDSIGRPRRLLRPAAATALVLALGGCQFFGSEAAKPAPKPTVSTARFTMTPLDGSATVAPESVVTVGSGGGVLSAVTLAAADGTAVPGKLSPGGASWHSSGPLKYGTKYTVQATAVDGHGLTATGTSSFTTATPETLVSVAKVIPEKGATVGVGMPVSVEFDQKIEDPAVRAAVEKRLVVATSTPVEGAWSWIDAKTVRFRPKTFWPADTKVSVSGDLYALPMGKGVYGGSGTATDFTVGSAVVATVDSAAHQMTVTRNGEVLKTVPVTTGKPGFTTRAGTKVILGKEEHVLMDGTTVGISEGSSESYRLDVYWAARVTWSGEYLHAAPWSVGSQGRANVSHGCVGMSTDNARWFFGVVGVGDVVNVVNTGSSKSMERIGNGYGEWNVPWEEWLQGSASGAVTTGAPAAG
ncbi:L,D-transpeptidase [Yinghuangia soli]|uniref:Ig-like domain-containing protein n=1 Tax=Yinghuangia soli TaxID=2908204 RepID=A0AA41Q6F4_9ACTN|nr:Ig-like domain-containing protein [Yinghuangia soli]MCF2531219.1 Ig-like domain-containing protein [Yinghuangia soli]